MTSNFWVKGCKFSAVVGTTLGLLIPGLPLLAAEPVSNLAGDSSFAPSEELLIAQSDDCSIKVNEYSTENYLIYICQNQDGLFLEATRLDTGHVETAYGVILNDNGDYEGSIGYRSGTVKYIVGDNSLVIYRDDNLVVNEKTLTSTPNGG